MKRLVIVGASGMVGGYALRYALEHPNVEHVTPARWWTCPFGKQGNAKISFSRTATS